MIVVAVFIIGRLNFVVGSGLGIELESEVGLKLILEYFDVFFNSNQNRY